MVYNIHKDTCKNNLKKRSFISLFYWFRLHLIGSSTVHHTPQKCAFCSAAVAEISQALRNFLPPYLSDTKLRACMSTMYSTYTVRTHREYEIIYRMHACFILELKVSLPQVTCTVYMNLFSYAFYYSFAILHQIHSRKSNCLKMIKSSTLIITSSPTTSPLLDPILQL